MSSCVNSEILSELTEIMGDDMAMLINSYIKDAREKLQQLNDSNLESEQQVIFRIAHSLKGSSRNVGVVEFADFCETIEIKARHEELQSADYNLQELNCLFEQVEKELTERFL